jgi:hypothetical protein
MTHKPHTLKCLACDGHEHQTGSIKQASFLTVNLDNFQTFLSSLLVVVNLTFKGVMDILQGFGKGIYFTFFQGFRKYDSRWQ